MLGCFTSRENHWPCCIHLAVAPDRRIVQRQWGREGALELFLLVVQHASSALLALVTELGLCGSHPVVCFTVLFSFLDSVSDLEQPQ